MHPKENKHVNPSNDVGNDIDQLEKYVEAAIRQVNTNITLLRINLNKFTGGDPLVGTVSQDMESAIQWSGDGFRLFLFGDAPITAPIKIQALTPEDGQEILKIDTDFDSTQRRSLTLAVGTNITLESEMKSANLSVQSGLSIIKHSCGPGLSQRMERAKLAGDVIRFAMHVLNQEVNKFKGSVGI